MKDIVTIYVGIDYHQKSIQVCIMDGQRKILANRACANDPEAMDRYVRRFGGRIHAGIEACCGTANFAEKLRGLGWSIDLAHPGAATCRCDLSLPRRCVNTAKMVTSFPIFACSFYDDVSDHRERFYPTVRKHLPVPHVAARIDPASARSGPRSPVAGSPSDKCEVADSGTASQQSHTY